MESSARSKPCEERELLQADRARPPRLRLADGQPAVVERRRPARASLPRRPCPRRSGAPPRPREAVDLLRDEALVEGAPRALDLVLARAAAALLDDAAIRRRERAGSGRARLLREPEGRGRGSRASRERAPRSARWSRGCARAAGSRARRIRSRTRGRLRAATSRSRAAGGASHRRRRERTRRGHRCPGSSSCPSSRKRSIVAAAGATPWPQSASGSPRSADQKTAGTSPPGPFRCGSTTCRTNPVATAASNALPPRSSTAIPVCEASQCVDATIPKVPRSSGRVVKVRDAPRSTR